MEKQIEEMERDLTEIFNAEYEQRYLITPKNTAKKLTDKGYRKERQGEWIKRENKSPTQIEAYCSICGRDAVYQVIDNRWQFENFCPHCGCKNERS